MSKSSGIMKLEEKIKPILEDLTLNVLKTKPDNIVSNILLNFIAFIYG